MYSAQELMKRNEIAKADEASSEAMKYFDYLHRDTERADALQARGRIRTKMGLAKSDSLEEVISTYLNTPSE